MAVDELRVGSAGAITAGFVALGLLTADSETQATSVVLIAVNKASRRKLRAELLIVILIIRLMLNRV
jgi:hypothetical protein